MSEIPSGDGSAYIKELIREFHPNVDPERVARLLESPRYLAWNQTVIKISRSLEKEKAENIPVGKTHIDPSLLERAEILAAELVHQERWTQDELGAAGWVVTQEIMAMISLEPETFEDVLSDL